ncbi:MAG: hypothetical protein ACOVP5_00195, partial [Chitinophagales bacterium]
MKLVDLEYTRPDIDGFLAKVKSRLEEMKNLKDYATFREKFLETMKLSTDISGACQLVQVRYSQNTKDEFYEKEQEFTDQIGPQIQKSMTDFTNMLLDSKHRTAIDQEFGPQFLDLAELARKSINEEVMPLLQKENTLGSEYQKLTAQIRIEFEGKI